MQLSWFEGAGASSITSQPPYSSLWTSWTKRLLAGHISPGIWSGYILAVEKVRG
jgi:hypothetical protein